MSLAAADFFLADLPVPVVTSPPEQDTALYNYLYQRQADSMGQLGVMALKFLRWMDLPDTSLAGESTGSLTAIELTAVLARLERGYLVPLGLVLQATGNGRLWENHQVLAFAAKERSNGVVEISVYDPNFPGDDDVVLRVTPLALTESEVVGTAQRRQVICERETGKGRLTSVRGFFAMPYTAHVPPANLRAER